MKKIPLLLSALLLVSFFAGAASAADPALKAVKARQAVMQLRGYFISQLGAMAKGKMDYNAKLAQEAADGLVALATMKAGSMWPKGSGTDNAALAGKSWTKPETWSTYPKVAEKGKAHVVAAMAMAAAAGTGLDGIRANMKALGRSCGGCHKPFRMKKKK